MLRSFQLKYEDFLQDFVGLTLQQDDIQKLFIAVDTDTSLYISMMELCGFIWSWRPHTDYEEGDLVVHITKSLDFQDVNEAAAFVTEGVADIMLANSHLHAYSHAFASSGRCRSCE